MATTNLSKVERLKLELRVGVATRLMDRVAYDEIREWLTAQGVPEEALPSDRSMCGYTETLEYGCLMQQRLDAHPELAGRAEPDPESMGLEAKGGALSAEGFVMNAKRWLTIRLRVADQAYRVYDHAAMMADRFEERLLMELEAACQAQDDEEEAGLPMGVGDLNTNKESLFPNGTKGMERQLLERAAKLPEVSPEDLQREAFWMARRNRLERDPRMLKPALFSRLLGQMMRILKEAREAEKAAGTKGGAARAGGHAQLRPAGGASRPTAPFAARPQSAPPAQSAGLRADSAAFGARPAAGTGSAKASTAGPGAATGQRPQSAPQPQPVGLRADSAAFGARTAAGTESATASTAGPGAATGQRPQSTPQAQSAGLRADSAAFGARTAAGTGSATAGGSAKPPAAATERITVEPGYAAAFYAAGREDGKGSLEDVPASFVARAHASGWTPQQAVQVARKGQLMLATKASSAPMGGLDHLDQARRREA